MGINSTFKEAVERATSPTLLEPDWAAILQVCDSIRQQDVSGKIAVSEIKKKIFDSNPHVSKNAIITLEACVKNCGSTVHEEVATKQFMDDFRQYLKICPDTVKTEILRIIQAWAHGFRNEPKYKVVEDTRNLLKMEGNSFPEKNESDAMFSALRAPDWADGDVCHRCRVKFKTFNRQHHCRCCGQVFCHKCSSKVSTIPKFGIEREVRVCDPCYDQLNPDEKTSSTKQTSTSSSKSDLPQEYLQSALAKESQVPEKKSDEEIKRQEQEDLQLAMALSVSEQESKQNQGPSSQLSNPYSVPETRPSAPAIPSSYSYSYPSMEEEEEEEDPELARYLNRPYWESRSEASPPEYRSPSSDEQPITSTATVNGEHASQTSQDSESEAFLSTFRSNIEKLMQRMQYVRGKGRHISTDTITQSLFQTVSAMHPQLLTLIEQQEQEKEKYEGLERKLGVLEETRHSLNDLRAQRREKLRQQELEQDMLRRMQMEQKMELLRQQKQEYMLYQQQLQMQRQQALEQKAKEQAMNYPVTSSYGMYQAPPKYPVPQDTTSSAVPDSYGQATYNPAGEVPLQYQAVNPSTQPPTYQSVTPGTQPMSSRPGAQRPAQPPQYQSSPNQYEPPITQYQSMSLQGEDRIPPAYQPGVQPGVQPAASQAQLPNALPPPSQNYQPPVNQLQPGVRQQNIAAQPPIGQVQYPHPAEQTSQGPPGQQQGQQTQPLQQPNRTQLQQPVGQYQNSAMRGSSGSYLDANFVSDSQQVAGQRQGQTGQGYPMEPDYHSSGPLSFQGQATQPPPALQNVYNRTPPSSGPPSLEPYSGQSSLPGQINNPPPGPQMAPPQQGPPAPPQHHGQPLQQGPPPSGPPSGPPSLQYPSQLSEPAGPYPGTQQSWGQPPSGNYSQPGQQPPPSYAGYEPVQQPYGQQAPQQYYEQNVAEAQLISFD